MSEGFVRMSDHVPAPRQWLWPGWIPMGCLTLLDGDPGTNKSTLLYEIAARVTTGRAMFGSDERHAPANVLLLQAEDTLDDIHNRLTACGADLTRVLAYDRQGDPIVLPRDVQRIEALIHEFQVRFLAIDPVMNFLTGSEQLPGRATLARSVGRNGRAHWSRRSPRTALEPVGWKQSAVPWAGKHRRDGLFARDCFS